MANERQSTAPSYTQIKIKNSYRDKLKVLAKLQNRSMANMLEVLVDKAAEVNHK